MKVGNAGFYTHTFRKLGLMNFRTLALWVRKSTRSSGTKRIRDLLQGGRHQPTLLGWRNNPKKKKVR
jgi:hypothetical protein